MVHPVWQCQIAVWYFTHISWKFHLDEAFVWSSSKFIYYHCSALMGNNTLKAVQKIVRLASDSNALSCSFHVTHITEEPKFSKTRVSYPTHLPHKRLFQYPAISFCDGWKDCIANLYSSVKKCGIICHYGYSWRHGCILQNL